jgi:hypothetical protein
MNESPKAFEVFPGGLIDPLQTVRKAEIESREPGSSVPVEESDRAARVDWGEEERRTVATFFTLLDQWDRDLNKKRQVA